MDVTDDYYKSISEKYQDVDTLITKLINHYEPNSEVTTGYLDGLYGKYGVKKKEQTKPTQPTQDAPLQGLGGVSEEPTPSPSVGQGPLRYAAQTQPTGEEFISGLTETATDRTSNLTDPERTRKVKRKGRLTKFSAEQNGIVGEVTYEDGTKKELAQDEYDALEKQEGLFDVYEEAEDYIDANIDWSAENIQKRPVNILPDYERRIQSERNENLKKYSLNVPNEELTEVFREPISEEENLDSYLSTQIGKVSISARRIADNPKAFGFPSGVLSLTPQEREDVVDKYVADATRLGFGRRISEDSPNLNESQLRNVFNHKLDQEIARKKAERDAKIESDFDQSLHEGGVSEQGMKPIKLSFLKKQDIAGLSPGEKDLYDGNVKLQDISSQIKSITQKYEDKPDGLVSSKLNVGKKTLEQRIADLEKEGEALNAESEKGDFKDQKSIDDFYKKVEAYTTAIDAINKEIEQEQINSEKKQKGAAKDQEAISVLMDEYKSQQEIVKSLMAKIGDDRRVMVDYITGQHVDKLSDDDDADITEAVNAQIVEFSQPTYKDQLDDLYIKVGLRDNRHREYGSNVKNDVFVATQGMARPLSSDAALNHLRSMGYETEGKVGGVVFKDVPLNVQASSYVINVLPDKGKETAERWIQENKKNIIERRALRDMAMLNVDPGGYDKSKFARGVEVLAEELLPSYVDVDKALGFISDRKLIDAAIPLLQSEGIELTKDQEKNLERTFGMEATELTVGMVPFVGKIVALSYMLGPVRALSGFDKAIQVLRSGDRVSKLTASFLEASFEEGLMQGAGAPTGMGFGFSVGGKLFKAMGLHKFPLRPIGDWARSNKALDAFWSHAIKGSSSAEFASVVESMIHDFEGGETWQNFADENYSSLSAVTRRMLLNAISFSAMGVKDLGFFIKKGKSGFNISNMEKARDEAQRKGYKEEADMLTKYINEYYSGKPDKAQPLSYNDMKTFVDNIPDNKSVEFTVSSREEIPVEFRDKKIYEEEGVEKEVHKTFLGIPTGKTTETTGKKYSYVATGKEMREVLEKMQGEKTEAEFEQEFDMSQKAEEPSVGKEVMRTEPTETVKRKGRVTKFSAKKGDIVGEIVFEDGTKRELTQKEYDALDKQEGLFDVDVPVEKKITKEEYEMQMAKKFAETQPTPKEPAAKEQLALGEGTPKELSPKQKEAYNGLTKEEKQVVDELIFDEQYELNIGAKDVEKPKDLTKEESAIWDYENKIAKESITYEDALNNALGVVAEKQKADGEVFTFGQDKYNIDKAVDLANTEGIEPVEIGIETISKMQMPFVLKTEEGIKNADLSKPVIVATTKDGLMLIDGHHRLEKAIREGKPVKAQILSESQTLEIKEDAIQEQAPKEAAPVEEKPTYDHPQLGESGKGSKLYMDNSMSGLKESDIEFGTAFQQQRSTAETTVKSKEWSGSDVIQDRVENTGDILRELSSRGDTPNPEYIQQKIDILRNWVKANNEIPLNSIPKEIKTKEDFDKSDLSWTNIKDGFEYLKKFNSGIAEQIKFEYEAISTYTKEQKLAKDAVLDLLNNNIKDFEAKLDQLQEVVNRRKKDGKIEIVKSVELGKAPTIKPKDAPKIEPLTKEEAKSEEKVKEFVEKNLSDEKKNEEADKEIESKSEEELKEDVPDVLESISEAERGKLDREAKNKRKSTVDYVIDYLKGKLKNVRQSIKNILDKIKSNYRKAIITTAVIASVVKGSDVKIGGTSLRDVFKDVTELVVTEGKSQGENLALDFAVENPEGFKAVSEVIGKNKYMSAIGAKAGVFKPKILKVEKPKVEKIEPIDTVNIEGLRAKIKSNDQVFGDKVEVNVYYPGVKAISYRNTFLAEEGQEYVIIPRRDERETAGNKDIEGVQYVAHFTLDDQMVGNERGPNSGMHKVSMETDGYVPYTTKKQGNREIITYKKYSEIADTAKGIGEILSTNPNIGPPLRQFKFGDIDWNAKPKWTSDKEREKEGYSGSRVMKTSVELLLKPGKKNPYRTGDMPNKDEYGNYLNPRGTYILYYGGRENAPTGDAHKGSIGKYNGGSFVYIFDYKGKTVVRDVGSSVGQLKEEGDAIIKQFGVNPKNLILGYHDAGSVRRKSRSEGW